MSRRSERYILHIDMDAFFAAVEQLGNPELQGQPVLVGGDPKGRGVVSAASYEARAFGCHSAMPMAQALRLCPDAAVVRSRIDRYAEMSGEVFDIAECFTPLIEPLSIDEAFLDITGSTRLLGPPEKIAGDLKERVREQTQLTASVGLAPNKFLAKLASDLDKPDGLVVVTPQNFQDVLDPLPISRLWGVGKATLPRFEAMGIHTFKDARRLTFEEMAREFGSAGEHFYQLVRGIDDREVVPDRQAKSISHEVTFATDVKDHDHLRSVILDQMDHVLRRLRRQRLVARTVNLKIRSSDFKTITRSTTLDTATDRMDLLLGAASGLFEAWQRTRPGAVRLIGVGVSLLGTDEGQQLQLFEQEADARGRQLDRTVDEIRDRFGDDAIGRGTHISE
ncbi:MAG: DNA polymerase IV [Phycisphaerales bacterium]|nr:MAG: DNA polymerase IV [Phycisphaerales bacterium]